MYSYRRRLPNVHGLHVARTTEYILELCDRVAGYHSLNLAVLNSLLNLRTTWYGSCFTRLEEILVIHPILHLLDVRDDMDCRSSGTQRSSDWSTARPTDLPASSWFQIAWCC